MNHVGQHTVATVGTFDGMHLGHQYLAKMLLDKAGERGGRAMVFTFASHPRREPLLMPVSDKVACIQKMGYLLHGLAHAVVGRCAVVLTESFFDLALSVGMLMPLPACV